MNSAHSLLPPVEEIPTYIDYSSSLIQVVIVEPKEAPFKL